jgi:hypothetical protein
MANAGRPQDVWKNPAQGSPATRTGGGSRRRWFAAALLVVLIGGTIAGLLVYLWPDPAPVLLAIPVTAYEHPDWQPNPWAEADARGFLEHAGGEGTQTFQAQEKQAILRELNRAADDARGRPLVVFISALGIAESGKVHLLPGGARPDDPGTWLALDDLLSPIRRATAPRLLILDIRPVTDPRGVLTGEDVNEALDAALARLEQAGDLPFFVLTANTPPEGANVLRPLHRTAFGLALAQGAGGEADGWNPERKRDGRVSVRELAAYTRELTHHISVVAKLPAQLPRLHGTGTDFDVFHVPRGGPAPLPSSADAEPYPDWLQAAWKDRDSWLVDRLQLRAPRVPRNLTLTATRAEQRWLAGGDPEAIKATFDASASRLREVRATLTALSQPVGSVARAKRKPGVNPTAAREALQGVFNRIVELPGPDRDKALATAMAAAWEKPGDTEPFDGAAAAIFSFAKNLEKPSAEQMKQLAILAGGFKPRPPRHAELVEIALIGGMPPDRTELWPPGTVLLMLDVASLAEEAAAFDGRFLPWVKATLAKADEVRRKAVRDLCDPKATDKLRRAAFADLEAVRADYAAIRAATDALTEARTEYEETRAVLADLAVNFPFEALALPEVAAKTWTDLTEDFLRVRRMLAVPAAPRLPDSGELSRAAQSLRANRVALLAMLRVPDSGGIRQLETLLRWPDWSQAERTKLLARLAEADRTAVRQVLDTWPKEPPAREPGAVPKANPRMPGELARTLRRWLAILRATDAPAAGDLVAELDRLGADPSAAAVAQLARKVRIALRRPFADAYAGADPIRQADIGWAVDPDDVPAFAQPGTPGPANPELPDQRTAEAEFHEWLARTRYTADASAFASSTLKPVQDAAAAYREISRAYSDAFR